VFCAETLGATERRCSASPMPGSTICQQRQVWGFRELLPLEQYELYRHIAPSIRLPREPRHRTPGYRAAGRRVPREPGREARRYRQAYAFAAAFSFGVIDPMGFELRLVRRSTSVAAARARPSPRFDLSRHHRPEPMRRGSRIEQEGQNAA